VSIPQLRGLRRTLELDAIAIGTLAGFAIRSVQRFDAKGSLCIESRIGRDKKKGSRKEAETQS